jgi:glutathione synthase/RimK-type ligase-like ATP-grasp enzyme
VADVSKIEPQVWLLAEKDDLATDLVVLELLRRSIVHRRVNIQLPLTTSVSWIPQGSPRFEAQGSLMTLQDSVSVWCRRLPDIHRSGPCANDIETLVIRDSLKFLNGLASTSKALWVNHPASISRAENKLTQLALASDMGLSIPRTLVTNDVSEARHFCSEFPSAVCKPISTNVISLGLRSLQLYTTSICIEDITEEGLEPVPLILQELITKKAEVRVTVVGPKIFACSFVPPQGLDFPVDLHSDDGIIFGLESIRPPAGIVMALRQMMQEFGLFFGCFDFILTPHDEWVFLELNPGGQWGWIEKGMGWRITEAIVDVLVNTKG